MAAHTKNDNYNYNDNDVGIHTELVYDIWKNGGKNACHISPEPKVTSSNVLLC